MVFQNCSPIQLASENNNYSSALSFYNEYGIPEMAFPPLGPATLGVLADGTSNRATTKCENDHLTLKEPGAQQILARDILTSQCEMLLDFLDQNKLSLTSGFFSLKCDGITLNCIVIENKRIVKIVFNGASISTLRPKLPSTVGELSIVHSQPELKLNAEAAASLAQVKTLKIYSSGLSDITEIPAALTELEVVSTDLLTFNASTTLALQKLIMVNNPIKEFAGRVLSNNSLQLEIKHSSIESFSATIEGDIGHLSINNGRLIDFDWSLISSEASVAKVNLDYNVICSEEFKASHSTSPQYCGLIMFSSAADSMGSVFTCHLNQGEKCEDQVIRFSNDFSSGNRRPVIVRSNNKEFPANTYLETYCPTSFASAHEQSFLVGNISKAESVFRLLYVPDNGVCPSRFTEAQISTMAFREVSLVGLTESELRGESCEENQFFSVHLCIECPANSTPGEDKSACFCNENFHPDNESGGCKKNPLPSSCTGNKYLNIYKCEACPANSSPSNDRLGCGCDEGYFADADEPKCNRIPEPSSCGADQALIGVECSQCPANGRPNSDQTSCLCNSGHHPSDAAFACEVNPTADDCGNGEFLNEFECMACPRNSHPDAEKQGCMCNDGYHAEGTACVKNDTVNECSGNEYLSIFNCQSCPTNSSPTPDKSTCQCNSGYFFDGVQCSKQDTVNSCTDDQFLNGPICVSCPANSGPTADKLNCRCDDGYHVDSQTGSCKKDPLPSSCGANEYLNDFECTSCPSNSAPTADKLNCQCSSGFYFKGQACTPLPTKDDCSNTEFYYESFCYECPSNSTPSADKTTCSCNSGFHAEGSQCVRN